MRRRRPSTRGAPPRGRIGGGRRPRPLSRDTNPNRSVSKLLSTGNTCARLRYMTCNRSERERSAHRASKRSAHHVSSPRQVRPRIGRIEIKSCDRTRDVDRHVDVRTYAYIHIRVRDGPAGGAAGSGLLGHTHVHVCMSIHVRDRSRRRPPGADGGGRDGPQAGGACAGERAGRRERVETADGGARPRTRREAPRASRGWFYRKLRT